MLATKYRPGPRPSHPDEVPTGGPFDLQKQVRFMALSNNRSRLVERLKSPRLRSREGAFLVEGVRGVGEVVGSPMVTGIRFVLFSPRVYGTEAGRALVDRIRAGGWPAEEVTDPELEGLSDTEHHQGVLLVVAEPRVSLEDWPSPGPVRLLLLDGIQDPGNAGTLVRAARAFGLDAVLALDGTVELYNPKVVRASAGALAHLKILKENWSTVEAWLAEWEIPLLVADAGGRDVRRFEAPPSWALVVGNEGAGPRARALAGAQAALAVPMEAGMDSLNAGVAGAILLFSLSPSFPERKDR